MEMSIEDRLRSSIRDVADFPQPGILFKDITPILLDAGLCRDVTKEIARRMSHLKPEAVAAIEARGFLFGILIAQEMGLPFIPIRKAGKLPYKTVSYQYSLEYGLATVEMHEDSVREGMRVMVHDDLLATGGTAAAAASLIEMQGGQVAGFSFLVELEFLKGRELLKPFATLTDTVVKY
jgi:adenine phosphoribosyltransferase